MIFQHGLYEQGEDKVYVDFETGGKIRIGLGTRIFPGVYIAANTTIGRHCRVGPNTTIGFMGFGYSKNKNTGRWEEKAHDFGVIIENDVHIGSNTCIARGSWRTTHIDSGTRIDNLVHVAHNVRIGKNVVIVAGSDLGGSVTVGDGAWIGLHSTVRQRRTIGKEGFTAMGAVVIEDVRPGWIVAGCPAKHFRKVQPSDY